MVAGTPSTQLSSVASSAQYSETLFIISPLAFSITLLSFMPFLSVRVLSQQTSDKGRPQQVNCVLARTGDMRRAKRKI